MSLAALFSHVGYAFKISPALAIQGLKRKSGVDGGEWIFCFSISDLVLAEDQQTKNPNLRQCRSFSGWAHIGQVELIPVNMCSENLPDHGGIEGWFPTFQTWRILFPTLLPNYGSCALAKGTSEMAAGNPLGIRL